MPDPKRTRALWDRVRAGDDEALQVLVDLWQEDALPMVPALAIQQIPTSTLLQIAALSVLETAALWQPEREEFAECLRRRVVARCVHFHLASFPLMTEIAYQ